jgi:hypothetical protein
MPKGAPRNPNAKRVNDPFGVFARYARHQNKQPAKERVKPLHEPDRRAFETLGFTGYVKADEIRVAYKKLVKLHHPDANGGDKSLRCLKSPNCRTRNFLSARLLASIRT